MSVLMIIIIVKTKLLFDSILTILITKSLSNIFKRWSGCAGWGGGWDTLLSSCYGCFSERNLMKLNFHLSDRILSKIEHFAARNKLSPAITLHGLTRIHSQHLHITQDWETGYWWNFWCKINSVEWVREWIKIPLIAIFMIPAFHKLSI